MMLQLNGSTVLWCCRAAELWCCSVFVLQYNDTEVLCGAAVTWFLSVYMVFQCYHSIVLQTDRQSYY